MNKQQKEYYKKGKVGYFIAGENGNHEQVSEQVFLTKCNSDNIENLEDRLDRVEKESELTFIFIFIFIVALELISLIN